MLIEIGLEQFRLGKDRQDSCFTIEGHKPLEVQTLKFSFCNQPSKEGGSTLLTLPVRESLGDTLLFPIAASLYGPSLTNIDEIQPRTGYQRNEVDAELIGNIMFDNSRLD